MEIDEYLAQQRREKRRVRHDEADEQIHFVTYVRAKMPFLPIFMSPIAKLTGATWSRRKQGHRIKQMGYTPGTPDLLIPLKGKCYHGLILEFKTKQGVVSIEQKQVMDHCQKNGYSCHVVRSCNEAIALFEWYTKAA